MSNKKLDRFYEKLDKNGLTQAFNKISRFSSECLDCYLEDLIDDMVSEMDRPICRVRYEKTPAGAEAWVFETRNVDEAEFHFAVSYPMKNDMISFQALTQVREYIKMGYEIRFR